MAGRSPRAGQRLQIYLFLFNGPMDGSLRISETRNFGGTRLEVDFVGGLDAAATAKAPPELEDQEREASNTQVGGASRVQDALEDGDVPAVEPV